MKINYCSVGQQINGLWTFTRTIEAETCIKAGYHVAITVCGVFSFPLHRGSSQELISSYKLRYVLKNIIVPSLIKLGVDVKEVGLTTWQSRRSPLRHTPSFGGEGGASWQWILLDSWFSTLKGTVSWDFFDSIFFINLLLLVLLEVP